MLLMEQQDHLSSDCSSDLLWYSLLWNGSDVWQWRRNCTQVHAALACMLHAERPREVGRAESQWEIANEFDTRFSDLQWVRTEKHWPPRLLAALENFLTLS